MSGFNPFIQVFYFYRAQTDGKFNMLDFPVLIPLFRSFIFTRDDVDGIFGDASYGF